MLKQAAKKISGDIKLICDDALNIQKYVADNSQDLILCQFLFSYLNSSEILKTACRILKTGSIRPVLVYGDVCMGFDMEIKALVKKHG